MQRLWFSWYRNSMTTCIFDLNIFHYKKSEILELLSLYIGFPVNIYKFSSLLINLLRNVLIVIISEEEDR